MRDIQNLRRNIIRSWLIREAMFCLGPESALVCAQKPAARFSVEFGSIGYLLHDHVWPSSPLPIAHEQLDHPNFHLMDEIAGHVEWSKKMLTSDSEDVRRTRDIIQRHFCEWIESLSSSIAGIRHDHRFLVKFQEDRYLVKDVLWPGLRFEIARRELFFNKLQMEHVLGNPIWEDALEGQSFCSALEQASYFTYSQA